jgi:hypothetical protein
VQIDGEPVLFSADKRAEIMLPRYRPGCDVYLFNLLKVYNAPRSPTLEFRKTERRFVRFAERKIRDLSVDRDGYYILKLP